MFDIPWYARCLSITLRHGTSGWPLDTFKRREEWMLSCQLDLSSCLAYQVEKSNFDRGQFSTILEWYEDFKLHQNVHFNVQHLAIYALGLVEPWNVNIQLIIAAAASVLKASTFPASLIQSLGLAYGRQRLFVLKRDVAVRVRGNVLTPCAVRKWRHLFSFFFFLGGGESNMVYFYHCDQQWPIKKLRF